MIVRRARISASRTSCSAADVDWPNSRNKHSRIHSLILRLLAPAIWTMRSYSGSVIFVVTDLLRKPSFIASPRGRCLAKTRRLARLLYGNRALLCSYPVRGGVSCYMGLAFCGLRHPPG